MDDDGGLVQLVLVAMSCKTCTCLRSALSMFNTLSEMFVFQRVQYTTQTVSLASLDCVLEQTLERTIEQSTGSTDIVTEAKSHGVRSIFS
jgi:hypothetical protein